MAKVSVEESCNTAATILVNLVCGRKMRLQRYNIYCQYFKVNMAQEQSEKGCNYIMMKYK